MKKIVYFIQFPDKRRHGWKRQADFMMAFSNYASAEAMADASLGPDKTVKVQVHRRGGNTELAELHTAADAKNRPLYRILGVEVWD